MTTQPDLPPHLQANLPGSLHGREQPGRLPVPEQDNSRQMPWWWQGIILAGLWVISLSYIASGFFGLAAWLFTLRNMGLGALCAALVMIGAEMLSPAKQRQLAILLRIRGNALLAASIGLLAISVAFHLVMDAFRLGYLP